MAMVAAMDWSKVIHALRLLQTDRFYALLLSTLLFGLMVIAYLFAKDITHTAHFLVCANGIGVNLSKIQAR